MRDHKSTDDVQQLLKNKHLGDLQYREFTAPQAAHLTLAGSTATAPETDLPAASAAPIRELPKASLPELSVPPRSGPAAHLSKPPVANATLPRSTVHESPLNFTFERLRRQVIPARASGPLIDLNLAPRTRAVMPERLELPKQRTLAEVFNALVHAPGARQHGA